MSTVIQEEQNGDYGSGAALIGEGWWRIRTARNTDTKPGAFALYGSATKADQQGLLETVRRCRVFLCLSKTGNDSVSSASPPPNW